MVEPIAVRRKARNCMSLFVFPARDLSRSFQRRSLTRRMRRAAALEPLERRMLLNGLSLLGAANQAVGGEPEEVTTTLIASHIGIFTANSDDTVSVLLGNGDGTFQTAQTGGDGLSADAIGIAIGNLDNTAEHQVLVINGSATVSIVPINSSGVPGSPQLMAVSQNVDSILLKSING